MRVPTSTSLRSAKLSFGSASRKESRAEPLPRADANKHQSWVGRALVGDWNPRGSRERLVLRGEDVAGELAVEKSRDVVLAKVPPTGGNHRRLDHRSAAGRSIARDDGEGRRPAAARRGNNPLQPRQRLVHRRAAFVEVIFRETRPLRHIASRPPASSRHSHVNNALGLAFLQDRPGDDVNDQRHAGEEKRHQCHGPPQPGRVEIELVRDSTAHPRDDLVVATSV